MSPERPDSLSKMLRQLPSVHELLAADPLQRAAQRIGRGPTRQAARTCLDRLRDDIRQGNENGTSLSVDELANQVLVLLEKRYQREIRRVINATGILLHTGLGRAPLAAEAKSALAAAAGYCNVETDFNTGERTTRTAIVEEDLCALTGAEAAHVVNNNAGAAGLVLATLAAGREVVVSHGELIEIGGGFRLPDVFRAYGAKLRAVGTTNRTRLEDYASAINDETAAVIVVHPSNYRVVGFTERPTLPALAELCSSQSVPLVHDIGSGALVDIGASPVSADPVARDSVRQGADLVLFSGDKLMGGPQCGVVVGKQPLVQQLARHPMSRALRVDKLTLAALRATLAIYRRAETDEAALDEIPFLRQLRTSVDQLQQRADAIATGLVAAMTGWQVSVIESTSYAGGGSLPGTELSSRALALACDGIDIMQFAQRLRTSQPSLFGRVHDGRLVLDLRSVMPEEDDALVTVVLEVHRRSCA